MATSTTTTTTQTYPYRSDHKIIFFDCETGGLDPEKTPILSIAMAILDEVTGIKIATYQSIVKISLTDWTRCDFAALKKNGIKPEDVSKGKPREVIANEINQLFTRHGITSWNTHWCGTNVNCFDRLFLQQIFPENRVNVLELEKVNADEQISYPEIGDKGKEQGKKSKFPQKMYDLEMLFRMHVLKQGIPTEYIQGSLDKMAISVGLPPEADVHEAMNGVELACKVYEKIVGFPGRESEDKSVTEQLVTVYKGLEKQEKQVLIKFKNQIPEKTASIEMSGEVLLDQGSEAWLAWRHEGIGASEAGAVCGLSPYLSPLELYEKKTNPRQPEKITFAMQWGINAEPHARAKLEKLIGQAYTPRCFQSKEYLWLRASLDGITADGKHGLEIKCSEKEEVDPTWLLQIQHQLLCCPQLEDSYLFVYSTRKGIGTLYLVLRDIETQEDLLRREQEFMKRIETKQPPEKIQLDLDREEAKAKRGRRKVAMPRPVKPAAAKSRKKVKVTE